MAILRDFGKSENDLGVWFPFGEEAPFEVRVRRIPYDVQQRISKRYGRETMIVTDGYKRPHIDRNLDEQTNWLLDQAVWAWTDAKGLEVEVADAEGAKLWSGLLKREVGEGEVIALSAENLTAEIKRRVLTQIRPFAKMIDPETQKAEKHDIATFIVLKAAQLQAEAGEKNEALRGN